MSLLPVSSMQSAGLSDEDLRRIDIVSLLCENSPIFLSELGEALRLNGVSIAGGLKTWIEGFSSLFEIRPLPDKDPGILCGWTGKDNAYWCKTPSLKTLLSIPELSMRAQCDGKVASVDIDTDNRHKRVRIVRVAGIHEDHFVPLFFEILVDSGDDVEKGDVLGLFIGERCKGTISKITEFGAFVNLGGFDGLLHISNLSWSYVNHPSDVVGVGQELEVVVLDVDRENRRVSLGLKQLQPNPWEMVATKYPINMRLRGKVVNLVPYGAFVELEPGIKGLIHVSEFSWTRHFARASDMLKVGDEVDVVVLAIDKENQKIGLGLCPAEGNPWDGVAERYPVGTRVKGKVRNFTSYGAFVQLEDGIDGMIHVSDMSWTRKINHPTEVLQKGDEVEAVVLEVDSANQRISLGLKQAQEDPWTTITSHYAVGQKLKGKVSKIASFGAFIELEGGVDGLVNISQISEEHVEKVKDALKIGQEVEARIVRIDREERRIVLSLFNEPTRLLTQDAATDVGRFFRHFPQLMTSCPQRTYLLARLIYSIQQKHSGEVNVEHLLSEVQERLEVTSDIDTNIIWSILPEGLFSQDREIGQNRLCDEVVEYANAHQWETDLSKLDVLNLWKNDGRPILIPPISDYKISDALTEDQFLDNLTKYIERCDFKYSGQDIVRFHTSVKCGMLTLVGGNPGTGKSSLVELYFRALGG